MARHRSPNSYAGEPIGHVAVAGSGFFALGLLGEGMDLGLDKEPSPRDAFMADPMVLSLKRARSPSKMPTSNSPGLSHQSFPFFHCVPLIWSFLLLVWLGTGWMGVAKVLLYLY